MSNYFFTKYPKLLVENPIIFITVSLSLQRKKVLVITFSKQNQVL